MFLGDHLNNKLHLQLKMCSLFHFWSCWSSDYNIGYCFSSLKGYINPKYLLIFKSMQTKDTLIIEEKIACSQIVVEEKLFMK